MSRLIKYFKSNLLVKVASLNSLSVFIRLVSGFLTSKFIAIFIGPEGLALIGNFKNILGPLQSLSTLGLYNGIVKYVSEFKNQKFKLGKAVSTSVFLILFSALVAGVFCWFASSWLSRLIFLGNQSYSFIFKVLALALPFYAFQFVVLAINNGMAQYKRVLHMSIVGHILVVVATLIAIWKFQLKGALMSMALAEVILFLIVIIWVRKDMAFLRLIRFTRIDIKSIKNFGTYSLMTLFSAIMLPLTMVFIRNYIIETNGTLDAGYWEAMNRISSNYLMFISSLMTLYYLPRFSEITEDGLFKKEILSFYKLIMPIFVFGLLLIYWLRDFVIKLVFSEEFLPVERLFKWQMLGDVIKVLATIIAYQFLAKRMLTSYIVTELISIVLLYFLSTYFIDLYGIRGATIAYFINYSIYFMIILIIFRKPLFYN